MALGCLSEAGNDDSEDWRMLCEAAKIRGRRTKRQKADESHEIVDAP